MGDVLWTGVNGNWADTSNWDTGVVPADNDDVHFTGDSNQDVTSGLTLGSGGDQLTSLNIHPDYTGSIGTAGGKLIARTIIDLRFDSEGGKLFVDTAGSVPSITNLAISSRAGINGMFEVDGIVTNVNVSGCTGTVDITSAAAVTNIDIHDSPNCILTINASVTAINRIRVSSGRVINNSAVTSGTTPHIIVTGGVLEQKVGRVSDLWIAGHGTVVHTAGNTSGISIDRLVGWGPAGVFDGRGNRNGLVTITGSRGYAGFTALLGNTMDSYVLTNAFDDFGALVVFEKGRGVQKG